MFCATIFALTGSNMIMRIALRVNITLRAVHERRRLKHGYSNGTIYISRPPEKNFWIGCHLQKRREP